MKPATDSRSVRYEVVEEIASGGMASVHLARALGDAGFVRAVAIKRPHAHVAKDPAVIDALLDEAKIAVRIRDRNVVSVIDVVEDDPFSIVMEYIHGASLASLLDSARQRDLRPDPRIAAAIVAGVLRGLHAAHEATNEHGRPLEIVHRDVTPHNVLVDVHGVSRVVDFGIAKAFGRIETTRDGAIKGKLAYLAPEQLRRRPATRRTDVYAAAVVLWEALTAQRLFDAATEAETVAEVLRARAPAPSSVVETIPRAVDDVVARALQRDPGRRFATADEMRSALDQSIAIAGESEVAQWVEELARDELRSRERVLLRIDPATAGSTFASHAKRPNTTGTSWARVRRPLLVAAAGGALVFVLSQATRNPESSHLRRQQDAAPPSSDVPSSSLPSSPSSPPLPIEDEPPTSRAQDSNEPPPTRDRPHRAAPRRPPATTPKPASSCDPPTYVDENGHTRYKRWCPL
jgi:eukaryotic-like serine/threonine-protein kinase